MERRDHCLHSVAQRGRSRILDAHQDLHSRKRYGQAFLCLRSTVPADSVLFACDRRRKSAQNPRQIVGAVTVQPLRATGRNARKCRAGQIFQKSDTAGFLCIRPAFLFIRPRPCHCLSPDPKRHRCHFRNLAPSFPRSLSRLCTRSQALRTS